MKAKPSPSGQWAKQQELWQRKEQKKEEKKSTQPHQMEENRSRGERDEPSVEGKAAKAAEKSASTKTPL